MSMLTNNALQLVGLCPSCGKPENSKEPYFMFGEDEECSFCSGEFYCACGNGCSEFQLETVGVCNDCR